MVSRLVVWILAELKLRYDLNYNHHTAYVFNCLAIKYSDLALVTKLKAAGLLSFTFQSFLDLFFHLLGVGFFEGAQY